MDKKEPKKASNRLLSMKFMQRSLEKEVQEQLEKERKRVISEAEWVLDTKDTEIQKPKIQIECQSSYLAFTPDSTVGRRSFKNFNKETEKTNEEIENAQRKAREEEQDDAQKAYEKSFVQEMATIRSVQKKSKKRRAPKEADQPKKQPKTTDQSAHAVVYKFDIEKKSWEKLGYEGVMFLTKGKCHPYFSLYVLNRLSIENYCLNLTDFEEINLTDEFIIYQTTEGEACALWLFEKKDRERILSKVQQLHEGIKSLPSIQKPQKPNPPEPKVDILDMLKKASDKTTLIPEKQEKNSPKQHEGSDLLHMLKPKEDPRRLPFVSEQPVMNGSPVQVMAPPVPPPNARNLSLLQVLQSGISPPVPPPIPPQQQPFLPQQQMMGLMQPEIARRFNGRPLLSKHEFIQQVLTMIQRDPVFLDSLYENYKTQMVPHPPPPSF
ncbi:hypothetical protein G6F22_008993 [Rhizopus arrhizus]|nr:hypothetical protein G6F22_008993 [Rhizopus arrhizus]